MKTFRRFLLSTCAVAVLGLAGGIASASHAMDFDALSGSFQLAVEDYRGQSDAGDKAIPAMEATYKKNSKGISKIANAVGKLDKAFKDDVDYQGDADAFMSIMSVVHIADSLEAQRAVAGAVIRNPRGPAARTAQVFAKKLQKLAGVQRLSEKLIRRFG